MPVAFHVVAREESPFLPWIVHKDGYDGVFAFAFLAIDVIAAFTQMVTRGLFEQYPRMRCAVLEAGSNWITAWLDRLDHKVQRGGFETSLKLLPSEYFRRQCWISADPDETTLAPIIPLVGEDRFFWASDFPPPDHPPEYVPEVARIVRELPESARAGFLGRNVLRAYGIET